MDRRRRKRGVERLLARIRHLRNDRGGAPWRRNGVVDREQGRMAPDGDCTSELIIWMPDHETTRVVQCEPRRRKVACAYTTSPERPRWSTLAAKRSGRCLSSEGSHERSMAWAGSRARSNGPGRRLHVRADHLDARSRDDLVRAGRVAIPRQTYPFAAFPGNRSALRRASRRRAWAGSRARSNGPGRRLHVRADHLDARSRDDPCRPVCSSWTCRNSAPNLPIRRVSRKSVGAATRIPPAPRCRAAHERSMAWAGSRARSNGPGRRLHVRADHLDARSNLPIRRVSRKSVGAATRIPPAPRSRS
jgi:hypothetical protein